MLHPEQKRIFASMPAEQKLKLVLGLYHSAKKLKRAGLKKQHPDWTEEQIEQSVREIFLYAGT
jgi:hypothetical protein